MTEKEKAIEDETIELSTEPTEKKKPHRRRAVVIIVVACESSTVLGQGKSAVLPFKVAFFCQFVVSHNLYHTKNVDNVRKFSMWLNQTSAL